MVVPSDGDSLVVFREVVVVICSVGDSLVITGWPDTLGDSDGIEISIPVGVGTMLGWLDG